MIFSIIRFHTSHIHTAKKELIKLEKFNLVVFGVCRVQCRFDSLHVIINDITTKMEPPVARPLGNNGLEFMMKKNNVTKDMETLPHHNRQNEIKKMIMNDPPLCRSVCLVKLVGSTVISPNDGLC